MLSAIYTKKIKILSCGYHGWYDAFSEVHGTEAGIPEKLYEDFYEFEFNNLDEIEELFKKNKTIWGSCVSNFCDYVSFLFNSG